MSLHRYGTEGMPKNKSFFPGTGAATAIGMGEGKGYTVNVPFTTLGLSEADYMAAFDHVLVPILKQFAPEFIIISAGFDAAEGEEKELGGMNLKPHAYATMTQALMELRGRNSAGGPRVLSCLEGGYDLEMISLCCEAMVRTQLIFVDGQEKFKPVGSGIGRPAKLTVSTPDVLRAVRNAHREGPWKKVIEDTEAAFESWAERTPTKVGKVAKPQAGCSPKGAADVDAGPSSQSGSKRDRASDPHSLGAAPSTEQDPKKALLFDVK